MILALEIIVFFLIVYAIVSILVFIELLKTIDFLKWDRDTYQQMYEYWLKKTEEYYKLDCIAQKLEKKKEESE